MNGELAGAYVWEPWSWLQEWKIMAGHALAMHFGDKVAGVTRVMRHTSEGVERR